MSTIREKFQQPVKLPRETVYLKHLDCEITVVGFTARERSEWETQLKNAKTGKVTVAKQKRMRERLIIACAVDENGDKLFTEADIDMLGKQPALYIELLVDACARVCGLSDLDQEDMGNGSDASGSEGENS